MRLILADDHELTRRGMRALIESRASWRVVAEAADGNTALREIEAHTPDVAIIDLALPGLHGLEVLREATRRSPRTTNIVLSMYGDEALVTKAFHNGAHAYVLKGARADDLLDAIAETSAGRRYLSATLRHVNLDARPEAPADRFESLTPREREVLQLTAEGLTSTGIADRLFISPRTVEKHRENLMAKLGLRGQSEVVRYAVERGLTAGLADGHTRTDTRT
jgi:DNA-binding NarL/FixJ family response regulator